MNFNVHNEIDCDALRWDLEISYSRPLIHNDEQTVPLSALAETVLRNKVLLAA